MVLRWVPIAALLAVAAYVVFGGLLLEPVRDVVPDASENAKAAPVPRPPPQPTVHDAFRGDPPHYGVYGKMVNEGDFDTSWFAETEVWNGDRKRRHRKQWELAYINYIVNQLNLGQFGKRALVFAVGKEALPSVLACTMGVSVLATDFDPRSAAQTGWTATNQWSGKKDDLFRADICSNRTIFDSRVEYRTADMNHIDPSLHGKFDLVWSTCSVEHVGSILLGQRFLMNTMDLLRPGGISIHTVEFTLSDLEDTVEEGPTVLWRKKDIEAANAALTALGHHPFPISWAAGTGPLDSAPDAPPYKQSNHLKLYHEDRGRRWIMTSFAMITRRGGNERQQ
ncbi:hypothetical protein DFJ74DRAFT_643101 [Hyaloraphidium curvatum]|nr:hypothetical protein DFJ74DRAFT_643101 [Hyaloraphidium curvatum]